MSILTALPARTHRSLLHVLGLVVAHMTGRGLAVRRRDERGLSQSTENAILLAGAVSVAIIVVAAITAYVRANLPR